MTEFQSPIVEQSPPPLCIVSVEKTFSPPKLNNPLSVAVLPLNDAVLEFEM